MAWNKRQRFKYTNWRSTEGTTNATSSIRSKDDGRNYKDVERNCQQFARAIQEEQRQLREANASLIETNKVLKRENLIGTSSIDGKERIILEEIKEFEKNQKITEGKLTEARSENTRLKAEMHYTFPKDER